MNPLAIFKLKGLVEKFRTNHPKFLRFLSVAGSYVGEGSVIEMKIKRANGQEILSNIKVTPDDIELFREFRNFAMSKAENPPENLADLENMT